MMIKNIKHASSQDIEIINDIKAVKFIEDQKYFMIARQDSLYILHSIDGISLIVDAGIIDLLKEKNIIGGMK